jgi:hypothetical protein
VGKEAQQCFIIALPGHKNIDNGIGTSRDDVKCIAIKAVYSEAKGPN